MFKQTIMSGFLLVAFACGPVLAQSEPVPPPAATEQAPIAGGQDAGAPPMGAAPMGGAPMGSGPSSMAPMHHGRAHALIMACRAQVNAQGIVGPGHRKAVVACVRAKRPGLAKRMICRGKGRHMGLRGASLHAFVRKCRFGSAG